MTVKFKLDENLGVSPAALLRAAGHDAATVAEQGLCSAPDPAVIEACRVENRCLVTLDIEFANPLVFKPAHHAGIAVIRLPARRFPGDLLDAIRTLIAGIEKEPIQGRLWIVQLHRIRVYQPTDEGSR